VTVVNVVIPSPPPVLSEDDAALKFAEQHKDDLRFCHDTQKWYQWTGKYWRCEKTKPAFSWARKVCRDLSDTTGSRGKKMLRAAEAAGVERFAQSDRVFAVTSDIWDTDKWLLGTPDGVVDLRTGVLRKADQKDFITKQTAVGPSEEPDCRLWLSFLNEATKGDQDLIRFVQQWCGYCLTGEISEQAFVFLWGPGGNGKGVFLNTAGNIMGDYCCTATMETFTASKSDRHPTELAKLRGARMTRVSETEQGRAWAEKRINQLTGGDRISARFMRQDFFEFDPQMKLTIIGNHKPTLRNVDDAAKRRINIVPFVHKPPVVDHDLEDKLKEEWPGILRWMINGCLDWQKNRLVRPKVVIAATEEYFFDQDILRQWVEECCDCHENYANIGRTLFESWAAFAKARNEDPRSQKLFNQQWKGWVTLPSKTRMVVVGSKGCTSNEVGSDTTHRHIGSDFPYSALT
jgi:putative DNA primase/helicase